MRRTFESLAFTAIILQIVCVAPSNGQSPTSRDVLDSLGLDPVLLHKTGYFTETRDGYVVVQDRDQRWYFAQLNDLGNIVPTNILVGPDGSAPRDKRQMLQTASRYLLQDPTVEQKMRRQVEWKEAAIDEADRRLQLTGKSVGATPILVLCIEFPDLRSPRDRDHIDSLMNINVLDSDAGEGGFRDYFIRSSYGQFIPESYVYGWFEAEHSADFYTDSMDRSLAADLLVEEALARANAAGVDFHPFDPDGDGFAGAFIVLTPIRIDAHFGNLNNAPEYQGVKFRPFAVGEVNLGVIAHEYGHALGLRDLYEGPSPFGFYDLMASATRGHHPGGMSAFSKIRLGWIQPTVVEEPVADLKVPNSCENPFALLIRGRNGTEWSYFVIENRVASDYDAGGYATVSGSGLLIYHIHEYSIAWSHVEQADGRRDLEKYHSSKGWDGNRGDAGDFFPGTTGNTSFDLNSEPSSRTEGGKDTGIAITHISQPGAVMTIDVSFPVGVPTEGTKPTETGYALHQNYPNPFSGSTTIPYDLAESANVKLSVFDMAGRRVAYLELGRLPEGSHRLPFDAGAFPSGHYVYRLQAGKFDAVKSMVVVR